MAGNLADATTDLCCAKPGDLSRDVQMAAGSSTPGSADVSTSHYFLLNPAPVPIEFWSTSEGVT